MELEEVLQLPRRQPAGSLACCGGKPRDPGSLARCGAMAMRRGRIITRRGTVDG
jgi:hypothetical protein